ncbi:hypothetical protein [Sneathiella glossodoripedis]|uniref:hypothetical protein n=1 Tax=Sneathiella glossodoripedis TaxID=418853 RepID=UPI000470AB4E|nr:hypothetical protein [Sneathiella glossodoripedis]
MHGISYWFIVTASIYAILGMVWGIQMSASEDHTLAPAHGHLNLIGWVSMMLYGFYYHLVSAAAKSLLAKVHFLTATASILVLTPGIAMVLQGGSPLPAKIGSILILVSALIFAFIVIRNRKAA